MKVANETSYSFDNNQTAAHLPHQQYCRRYFLSLIKRYTFHHLHGESGQ